MSLKAVEITLKPHRLAAVAGAVVGALLVIYAGLVVIEEVAGPEPFYRFGTIRRIFDLDGETNVAAWYSFLALAGCALLAVLIAMGTTRDRGRRHWWGLGMVLLYLSADEAALLHEELSAPTIDVLGLDETEWEFWAWVFPALLASLIFAAVYVPFVRRLPRSTRRVLVSAGALYVAGAAGMELVGKLLAGDGPERGLGYLAVVGVEELLEMGAVVVLAFGLVRHLRDHVGPVTVTSGAGPSTVDLREAATDRVDVPTG